MRKLKVYSNLLVSLKSIQRLSIYLLEPSSKHAAIYYLNLKVYFVHLKNDPTTLFHAFRMKTCRWF